MRVLHFCPCCEAVHRRLGQAMLAEDLGSEAKTLEDRPPLRMPAVLVAR